MSEHGKVVLRDGVTVWIEPSVTLLSSPRYLPAPTLRVNQAKPGTEGGLLAEFAGRLCYMSQDNVMDRSTEEYLANIIEVGHGSVLEHANYSMLFEGVSRSLTHELVRHRAGFAYSQLSQRYVSPTRLAFVMPMELMNVNGFESSRDLEGAQNQAISTFVEIKRMYEYWLAMYSERARVTSPHLGTTDHRKVVRQSARFILPNSTETKIVVTANARSWRHFLTMRGSPKADPEIRRLAVSVFRTLAVTAPEFMHGLEEQYNTDFPSYPLGVVCSAGEKV